MADNIKLIVAVIMMVVAITLFYSYSEYSTLFRVLGLLAVTGLAIFIASKTAIGGTMFGYIGATRTEVRKVVWPTRQETLQTTLVVLLMVLIVALLLWGFDSLLGWAVRSLMI